MKEGRNEVTKQRSSDAPARDVSSNGWSTEFSLSPIYANERYTLRYRGIGVCTTVGCLLFERRAGFDFKIWDFTTAQGSACAFCDAYDGFGGAGESRSVFWDVSL